MISHRGPGVDPLGGLRRAFYEGLNDGDGARQPVIMVPPGTTMTPDGGQPQVDGQITIRQVEYTVGAAGAAAMPGGLPPTSAYTYAIELRVDEVPDGRVSFNQPLVVYVENFLDFPKGTAVPLGWYDRESLRWQAAENGRVIRVTDTGLDIDDDAETEVTPQAPGVLFGGPEVDWLLQHFADGTELWRVAVDHFTPFDCNWPPSACPECLFWDICEDGPLPEEWVPDEESCINRGLCCGGECCPDCGLDDDGPDDCPEAGLPCPLASNGEWLWQEDAPPPPPCSCFRPCGGEAEDVQAIPDAPPPQCNSLAPGSVIYCESQVLAKSIAIPGTPYALRYSSDRVPGRFDSFTTRGLLRTPGFDTPPALVRAEVLVDVAGRRIVGEYRVTVLPGAVRWIPLSYSVRWDGLDGYGRPVQGPVPATVKKRYYFNNGFVLPADADPAFGEPGQVAAPVGPESGRGTFYVEVQEQVVLGGWDNTQGPLGGWSLDVLAARAFELGVVYGGEGSVQRFGARVAPLAGWFDRVAGPGTQSAANPGNQPHDWRIHPVVAMATGPDGRLYIAEHHSNTNLADGFFIRRIEGNGSTITRLAGAMEAGIGAIAGPNTSAWGTPTAEHLEPRAAVDSRVTPSDMTVGPDGTVYLAEWQWGLLRAITPGGELVHLAGSSRDPNQPQPACDGDGEAATDAVISLPRGLTIAPDGRLFFLDGNGNAAGGAPHAFRIRVIEPNGDIRTWAADDLGGGNVGACGGNQAPYPAPFTVDFGHQPVDLLATEEGLYIAEGGTLLNDTRDVAGGATHGRIRLLTWAGQVSTVIGDDLRFQLGESEIPNTAAYYSGAATSKTLYGPNHLVRLQDGAIAFSAAYDAGVDGRHTVIVRAEPLGVLRLLAGGGDDIPGVADLDGGPIREADLSANNNGLKEFAYHALTLLPDGRLAFAWERLKDTNPKSAAIVALDVRRPDETPFDEPSVGGAVTYTFDEAGRHSTTVDAITGRTLLTFEYQGDHLIGITDADDRETTFAWTGDRITSITSPDSLITTLAYDDDDLLVGVGHAGRSVAMSYHPGTGPRPAGLLATFTNPRGHTTEFDYDFRGRLESDRDPAGGETRLDRQDRLWGFDVKKSVLIRNPAPPPQPQTIFRDTVYTVEHDTEGVTRITTDQVSGRRTVVRTTEDEVITNLPDGTRILTTLAESPLHPELDYAAATQVVLPNGDTLWSAVEPGEVEYQDGLIDVWQNTYLSGPPNEQEVAEHLYERLDEGWQETLTTAAGREAFLRYDADGRLIESGVANLAPTEYAYDQDGRLTEMAAGDRTTTMSYNMWGRLAVVTDPLGRQLRYTYNGAGGHLTSVGLYANAQAQEPIQTIEFTFDENGNLTSLTPPNDEVHASTYNAVDLEVSYTPPEVDPENSMVTHTDWTPDRRIESLETGDDLIEFQYTPTGKHRSISYFHDTIWFSYHPNGNPAALETANGNVAMRFAWNGPLLTGENLTLDEVELGRILYGYDTLGRPVDQTLEVGHVVQVLHAELTDGELTGLGRGTGANYVEDLSLTRNAAGLPHVVSIGDLDTTYTYNAHGEVLTETTTDGQGVVFARAYTRDALGRITAVEETEGANSRKLFYSYDIAGRLVAECQGTAVGQGDDACGPDTDLIAEYTYDANGNRLTRDEPGGDVDEEAEYDAQDRLVDYAGVAHTFGDRGELQAAGTWSFDYDAMGNLVQASKPGLTVSYLIDPRNRRIGRDDGVTQRYWLYHDQLEPIAELDGNGALVARFVYGVRAHSPDYMVRFEGGNEVLYRYITDHLGSVRLVVRVSDGEVAQRLDYDAFGRVLDDTHPGFQPFGFAGGLYDADTGLVRFGARDYDPFTGRWTAKDPIRWAGGQANLYEYVSSDPVNLVDVTGLDVYICRRPMRFEGWYAVASNIFMRAASALLPTDYQWEHAYIFMSKHLPDVVTYGVSREGGRAIQKNQASMNEEPLRDLAMGRCERQDSCIDEMAFEEMMRTSGTDFGPYEFTGTQCQTWARQMVRIAPLLAPCVSR